MAQVTSMFHDVVATGTETLGTAFNTTDVLTFDMTSVLAYQPSKAAFHGFVEGIHIKVTSIAGGATKLTMRLCLDPDGDEVVVPDTEATLVTGVTTATTGSVAFSVQLPIFQILTTNIGNLYLFAKLDAGSAVFAQGVVTWKE
jgi:hypothetical protein